MKDVKNSQICAWIDWIHDFFSLSHIYMHIKNNVALYIGHIYNYNVNVHVYINNKVNNMFLAPV